MRIWCNHQKDKTIHVYLYILYIQSLFFISRISLFYFTGSDSIFRVCVNLWEIELGIYWTIYITTLVGVYFSFRDIWLFTEVHFWRCWMRIFIGSSRQPSKCKMDVCRYVMYVYTYIYIYFIWIDYNDVSVMLHSMNFRNWGNYPNFLSHMISDSHLISSRYMQDIVWKTVFLLTWPLNSTEEGPRWQVASRTGSTCWMTRSVYIYIYVCIYIYMYIYI